MKPSTMILIGWSFFIGTSFVSAHPFHASIAEAEWNPKTKKLEVALWVHPTDLEQALRQHTKKRVDLDKTLNVDQLIQAYLKDVLVVKDKKGRQQKLEWVGKEIKVKGAWLYFEIPLTDGLDGAAFRHRLFFELLADQVNTVNFRHGKKRKSLTFTQSKPGRVFHWQDAEETGR